MPRKARELSRTNIYHVMLRGINRQTLFEDNEDMTRSYLMIAPDGRFFQNGGAEYAYSSHSLWEKPADELLAEMDFDEEKFKSRYNLPESSDEEKNSNF